GKCAGECSMCLEPEICGGVRGIPKLLDRPCLTSFRIAVDGLRRESVEREVIRGMHGNELPLQVCRELGDREAVLTGDACDLVAVSLAFGGAFEIEEARVPRRNLHPLVAKRRCPLGDVFPGVEGCTITRELREENGGTFYCFHLTNLREMPASSSRRRLRNPAR